jgi:hypothetical protein
VGCTPRARRAIRAWTGLVGLAMITAGLGAASSATADAATAAASRAPAHAPAPAHAHRLVAALRPTAIGVDRHGTSYVGFATGGALLRMSASGERRRPVPLDQGGAVHAVFSTSNSNLWVNYGSSVSLLKPGGRVLQHFGEDLADACAGLAVEPARYGGITATRTTVYVASGCDASVHVYTHDGRLRAVLRLPGGGLPRGIAYGAAQGGRSARLYVAQPDLGRVLTYDTAGLRGSSRPVHRLDVRKPDRGFRPAPAGVVVDGGGQLVVSDSANNSLNFYDTNHAYSLYRTLGHGPRRGGSPGRLNHPAGIAQHAQDGGSLSGNLFIADSDNHRVQRWDTGGYTHWSKRVRAPGGSGGGGGAGGGGGGGGGGDGGGGGTGATPVNTVAPQITGSATVGERLACSTGSWTHSPTSYARAWFRDGTAIPGADQSAYLVAQTDVGHEISCRVRATNAAGASPWAPSGPVNIPAGGGGGGGGGGGSGSSNNLTPPTIVGTPAIGQTLTCDPGTWVGSPLFAYSWLRAGVGVGANQTYLVQAADVGQPLVCVVVASAGPAGSGQASSAPVTPTGAVPAGACAGPVGVSIDDGAATATTVAVTLRIRPTAGVTTVTIANDGGFVPATTVPVTATCAYSWSLQAAGVGVPIARRVYVRFGTDPVTYSDDIVVDQARPRNAGVSSAGR